MRTPIAILAGTLLVACASGTRVVYVPVPASTTTPVPAPTAPPARVIPAPMPPVGVTIVRVDDRQVLVSTNQPAYLAVFEIVPNRGVTLVYPTSPVQRQFALTGSNWLNVSWRSERGLMDDDARDARGRRRGPPVVHHVYAVASERPLRLTPSAFDDRALAAMLGYRLTQAADPYETMAALSRRFVPPGKDEDWGEDVYVMDVARPVVTVRIAKIYCPDGSVVYARDEMIDRTACPWQSQGRNVPAPSRPDSVVASNGRRVPRPMEPGGVARIFRVPGPTQTPDAPPTTGGNVADTRPGNGTGTGAANGNGGKDNNAGGNVANNGNANNGNASANNGNASANNGNASANNGNDKGNNGNHYGQEKNGNNGNNGNHYGQEKNGNNGNGNGQAEVQQQGKPDRPSPVQPSEPKPADPKPVDVKPEPPRAEPAPKDAPKPEAKPETKPETKPENKGMRGVMDRMRAKADS
ncbi:MAG: hypothetical protein HOQ17_12365, partial [Gemmatimonadaceae bacterium]|nr:hypothetical protein [Gemmatimonadaceae bacterium]NUS33847.1 hypothetical protein [Gemmatimonadaceae bacterium]